MSRHLRHGTFYEPVDVGLNNTLVGIGANVKGNILPWTLESHPVRRIGFIFTIESGAGALFDVAVEGFGLDGATSLVAFQTFWTGIDATGAAYYLESATPNVTKGAAVASIWVPLLTSPFVQFDVKNQDTNPANISLRAWALG